MDCSDFTANELPTLLCGVGVSNGVSMSSLLWVISAVIFLQKIETYKDLLIFAKLQF
jgi:hypothetical protein